MTVTDERPTRLVPAPVLPVGDEYVWALASQPTAPAAARHAARLVLARWGLDEDTVYDAVLVVSELVTNAVEHALPPIALHLQLTRTPDGRPGAHISVTDGGPAPASGPWTSTCAPDEHGRGRTVVSALATHTGTQSGPTTARWATVNEI
ncbi:ATP-binding protein [Streptomyces mirabilis]|uniref:ATP-binding protein n=1 Tax=Streptomyces mirabilis TaxID=68239 RepID=UPI0037F49420